MPIPKSDRRFLETWLRRTARRLSASGGLSQFAVVLAAEEGGNAEEWRARLRGILDGEEQPSLELLTKIDALLARPVDPGQDDQSQQSLF